MCGTRLAERHRPFMKASNSAQVALANVSQSKTVNTRGSVFSSGAGDSRWWRSGLHNKLPRYTFKFGEVLQKLCT